MRLAPIASGSSGNSIYVGSDNAHILIDAGISGKRIVDGLKDLDLALQDINGILVTHEHSDHISGLGVLSRKHEIPIYATKDTISAMLNTKSLGKMNPSLFCEIEADKPFCIKDLEINPIRISHDAADPVAYSMRDGNKKMAVLTDLGCYDDYIVSRVQDMDVIMIEANHNVRMVEVGPYPYYLKQRILGKRGHLSNEVCGRLLREVIHSDLKQIILGHLSKENNQEELAYETVRMELMAGDHGYMETDFNITVANRSCITRAVEL